MCYLMAVIFKKSETMVSDYLTTNLIIDTYITNGKTLYFSQSWNTHGIKNRD